MARIREFGGRLRARCGSLLRPGIGGRLAAGFGVLLALLAVASATGVDRMNRLNQGNQVLTGQQLPVMMDTNAWIIGLLETSRHMQNIVLTSDKARIAAELQEVRHNKAERKDLKKKVEAALLSDKVAAALDGVADARAVYLPSEDQFIGLVRDGDIAGARNLLLDHTLPVQRAYIDQLYRLIAAVQAEVEEQRNAAAANYVRGRNTTTALSAAAALLGVLIAWGITRSITRPLRLVVEVADRIAAGRLDSEIPRGRSDETGRLLESMAAMQRSLQGFIAAQIEMARSHADGQWDHRIHAAGFPGTYGEMADSVNQLVDSQITVTRRMGEVIQAYAIGDFALDMPELPGEQGTLTRMCADAKRNLLGIQDQITRMCDAAARGDFSVRGDPARFHYAFRDMVSQLNRMMAECGDSLADVSRLMESIAAGDLTRSIDRGYPGTFGKLQSNANQTARRLQETVLEIRSATDALAAAAREIAARNRQLSERTERQAGLVRETAGAMLEQTTLVARNAGDARTANELAEGASEVARKGSQAMDEVVRGMSAISQSSNRIANIIGAINEIAFQTNILALNAAVEAARAGDQGRGFAVVAGEVRSLALRSATAAKEIRALIEGSSAQVEIGSRQVSQAGTTMSEILASVERVNEIMGGIRAASTDQSARIAQVNRCIEDMAASTDQNVSFVEESAEAARSMQDLADSLSASVAQFKVAG